MFDFDVVTTVEEAQFLLEADVVAFDIETDARDYEWAASHKRGTAYAADISHISFYAGADHPAVVFTARSEKRQYRHTRIEFNEFDEPYIDPGCEIERYDHCWTEEEEAFLRELFSQDKVFVAHNLIFDARQVYGKLGIPIPEGAHFYDTMVHEKHNRWHGSFLDYRHQFSQHNPELSRELRGKLIGKLFKRVPSKNPHTPDHLDDGETFTLLGSYMIHWGGLTDEQFFWLEKMKKNRKRLHRLDPADVQLYSAWDSVAAYRLWERQNEAPKYKGYEDQLLTDLDYTKLGVRMAVEGVRVDVEAAWNRLLELRQQWVGALHDLGLTVETEGQTRNKTWLEKRIIDTASPPSDEAIEKYGLKTAKGAWSFNKKALSYYLDNDHSLKPLKKLKELEVEIAGIEEFIRHAEYDGRVHSIMARAAVTGRNTSGSPNLQNIDFGRFAGLLIGDSDEHQLIELDYSNAENWALAGYSGDDNLALACAAEDFHSAMARGYFGEDLYQSMSDKEWHDGPRKKGKAITFGTAYGMGPDKLARTLGVSESEARLILDNKARSFPDVERVKEKSSRFADKYGYTILWDGRRVKIQEYFDGTNKGYTAINSLNQGGVAALVARAMLEIERLLDEKYPRSRIALQVHDSIIVSLHRDDYPNAVQEMIEIMATIIPDDFNNRTTPACRWLVTLDNRENAGKWGYRYNREYLLPLDEYVNRWGVHKYEPGEDEAPVWINEWGYGDKALQKEMEYLYPEDPGYAEESQPDVFNWVGFFQAVRFLSLSMTPINGVPFADWVEGTQAEQNCRDFIAMLRTGKGLYPETYQIEEPFTWAGFERRIHDLAQLTVPMRFINGRVYEFPEAMAIREELFHRGHDVEPLFEVLDRIGELVAYTREVETAVADPLR